MDEKSLHTLEFDKVLARLAALTAFAPSRELALALRPTADHTDLSPRSDRGSYMRLARRRAQRWE